MRILFLYTELADYTLACLKALKNTKDETEISVVHYPINPEAPFDFDFGETGTFTNIREFKSYNNLKEYVDAFHPEKIVLSGWSNKWYLRICMAYKKRAICILTMDNHWMGTLKQAFFILVFRIVLISVFKKIWVPGEPQKVYAKKLGFKEQHIISGFYCCDVDFYSDLGNRFLALKEESFPKRLLCVARYIPAKNYETLWQAFIQWKAETNNDWELWCAGTGEDFSKRIQHPAVRHLGFVQKKDWDDIIAKTGVFILPSSFEPWSVAVHEFAAAGYPLVLSSKVGASSTFLEKGNGWLFDPFDKRRLISIFREIESLPLESIYVMGAKSIEMAWRITPLSWASALQEV
ncbi:glycosyl transferase family 1 [Terrimonas sp.]|uniref:glycosyltransferase n=1 Tax=Terrimonas sp. TaxID=1914338 RepID=UPI000D520EAA|nr:glycosyltransferase [Terrimonas sp.]PVD52032.1 glycosyl transferase family 1 [Terrimonas sp.]